jgi:restriction system protein
MAAPIYPDSPDNWQDLEARVAQVLQESGYEVELGKSVTLARGSVRVDAWADDHSSPPNVIVVECKHWSTRATKSVVHAFRAVVDDSGANTGLIVSSAGFQSGAVDAAAYSNVRLLDWMQFQAMFTLRWFANYMRPRIAEETDALREYTEPMNSRVFRKADDLPPDKRELFKALRET